MRSLRSRHGLNPNCGSAGKGLIVIGLLNTISLFADNVSYSVEGSAANCFPVKVSNGWSLSRLDSSGGVIPQAHLVFRKPESEGDLLVTFDSNYGVNYNPNKYRVALRRGASPKRASEEDWRLAIDIPSTRALATTESYKGDQPRPDAMIDFGGHRYSKLGKEWLSSPTRLSPNRKYLALQSFNGKESPFDWLGDDPLLRTRGTIFSEIYEVSTGEKKLSIRGSYRRITESEMGDFIFWLTNRYFILPMRGLQERIFVCDFAPEPKLEKR